VNGHGGHGPAVAPALIELAVGRQPGVGGDLAVVPLDNEVALWDKSEDKLLDGLR
jgi:hypothetical protein